MNRLMRAASDAWDGAVIVVVLAPRGWDGDDYYRAEARRAFISPGARHTNVSQVTSWIAGQAFGNSPRKALRNLISQGYARTERTAS